MFIINNGNLAVDIPLGGSSCPLFPGGIGIWNLCFFEGGKPEFKLQQTQPTCNIRSGNQTQATAVGGKHPYQSAVPTSKFLLFD